MHFLTHHPPEQKFCFLVWSHVRWLKHRGWHLHHYWHRYHERLAASEMSVKMWSATPIQSWQMTSTSKWAVGLFIFTQVIVNACYFILFYFFISFFKKRKTKKLGRLTQMQIMLWYKPAFPKKDVIKKKKLSNCLYLSMLVELLRFKKNGLIWTFSHRYTTILQLFTGEW